MVHSRKQLTTAGNMIDAVGYLIGVADNANLTKVSNRLEQVRAELSLVTNVDAKQLICLAIGCDDSAEELPPQKGDGE